MPFLWADRRRSRSTSNQPKIFGIGLSRTGTTSLTHALTILGFRTVHMPIDEASRREITWFSTHQDQPLRLTVLEDNDAVTDLPVCCSYRGLDRAYFGSRFILTVREKESWLDSYERLWAQVVNPFYGASPESEEAEYGRLLGSMLWRQTLEGRVELPPEALEINSSYYDRDLYGKFYDAYHERVYDYFKGRDDQLLTFHLVDGEGWEKLAPFLGKPIPEEPFPAEMRLRKRMLGETGDDDPDTAANKEVVRAYLEVFARRDLDSCVSFFADDAVVKMMEKRYKGPRAIAEWHKERFKAQVALLEVGELAAVDDLVTVDLTVGSSVLKRWRINLFGQAVIRVRDDKILELGLEGGRIVR